MSKISKISGFPELLPEQKLVEERIVQRIRSVYQRAGFVPIETPAVELLSTLQAKGEVNKEIYVLKRVHADENEREKEELALHFDLTVPFSRYVAQHYSSLTFPFKRYQLQKVWRGERPQKGRYRELYQFDIDVICRDEMPLACDAEVLEVYAEALATIGLPPYELRINDRRILLGFYSALGLSGDQQAKTIAIVDKLAKIGSEEVERYLTGELSLSAATARRILDLTKTRITPADAALTLGSLEIDHPQFREGVESILALLNLLGKETLDKVVIDLSLARGLDYYTGLILEAVMIDHPEYGSIGAGGSYADLASRFISHKLPGVGFTIGLSRILGFLFESERIKLPRANTVQVLVTVLSEGQRSRCNEVARELRKYGVSSEVFYKSPKLGKQLDHADAKGIPYALFVGEADGAIQVKDLRSKDQFAVPDLKAFAEKIGPFSLENIHG